MSDPIVLHVSATLHDPAPLVFREVLGEVSEGIGEGRTAEIATHLSGAAIVVTFSRGGSSRSYVIRSEELIRAALTMESP